MIGTRVCVIGAGAAGLSAAHHLAESPELFTFTVFEQTAEIGGTWVYTEETDCDEYGLPIHSSMYRHLRTNLPKEIMSFIDYKFEDSAESFVHHTAVLKYLKSYCDKYELHQYIKFRTHVTEVRPIDKDGGKAWSIAVQDLSSKEVTVEEFDAVIVCNGHFSKPYIPSIPGIEGFHGICVHSHVYRNPSQYKDKKVIILGASSSGIDICLEVSKHAKEVFLSHNLPPLEETADKTMQGACHVFSNQTDAKKLSRMLPCNVTQVAGIDSFSGDVFILRDGAECSADVVIFCTGYEYDIPFLHPSCGVLVKDKRISPLYKHLIHIEFPTLCFIGIPFSVIPFPVFDYQVIFFLKMLDKSVILPSKEDMYADTDKYMKEMMAKGIPVRHFHKLASMQWEYLEQLAASSGVQPLPQVVRKIYDKTAHLRKSDLLTYKNFMFTITNDYNYELCQ